MYLERTAPLHHSTQLFISTVRPYKALDLAAIDVRIFKQHSSRATAASAAQRKSVKLLNILNMAGSTNEATFARFYYKKAFDEVIT